MIPLRYAAKPFAAALMHQEQNRIKSRIVTRSRDRSSSGTCGERGHAESRAVLPTYDPRCSSGVRRARLVSRPGSTRSWSRSVRSRPAMRLPPILGPLAPRQTSLPSIERAQRLSGNNRISVVPLPFAMIPPQRRSSRNCDPSPYAIPISTHSTTRALPGKRGGARHRGN